MLYRYPDQAFVLSYTHILFKIYFLTNFVMPKVLAVSKQTKAAAASKVSKTNFSKTKIFSKKNGKTTAHVRDQLLTKIM